jgi:hypothetical protein
VSAGWPIADRSTRERTANRCVLAIQHLKHSGPCPRLAVTGRVAFRVELCGNRVVAQTLTARLRAQLPHVFEDDLLVRPESVRLAPFDAVSFARC